MPPTTISIITPSYNQGEFIEETIRSVLSQAGDFRLDYIIMDGGSRDSSLDIIEKYSRLLAQKEWPVRCAGIKYRWVSEKDDGQAAALQKGFTMAEGDIGAWLNSDDTYCATDVLAKVQREFAAAPALDMLTADGVLIDRRGKKYGTHRVAALDLRELIYLDYHILQPATFIAKRVYQRELLDSSYTYCFDAEYFIRLISRGYRFKKTDDSYASFRLYPETKTLSGQNERYAESLRISKSFGADRPAYLVSRVYKYWDMVVAARYPANRAVKALRLLLRAAAYKIILNRWRR